MGFSETSFFRTLEERNIFIAKKWATFPQWQCFIVLTDSGKGQLGECEREKKKGCGIFNTF